MDADERRYAAFGGRTGDEPTVRSRARGGALRVAEASGSLIKSEPADFSAGSLLSFIGTFLFPARAVVKCDTVAADFFGNIAQEFDFGNKGVDVGFGYDDILFVVTRFDIGPLQ